MFFFVEIMARHEAVCVGQIPNIDGYQPGQQLNFAEMFSVGDMVDVAGTSIGKGFQGAAPTPFPTQLSADSVFFSTNPEEQSSGRIF